MGYTAPFTDDKRLSKVNPDDIRNRNTIATKLAEFMEELRKQRGMSNVNFYTMLNASHRIYLGFDDEPIVRGNIRFEKDKYVLSSPNVSNNRYGTYYSEHYCTSSKDFNRSIRKALEVFTLSNAQITRILKKHRRHFLDLTNEDVTQATRKMTSVYRHLVSPVNRQHPQFVEDILHYFDGEPEKVSQQTNDAIKELKEAREELNNVGKRVFECYEVFFLRNMIHVHSTARGGEEKRYTQDSLPRAITEKISVLSMLETDQYVQGVGVKYSNLVYCVMTDVGEVPDFSKDEEETP